MTANRHFVKALRRLQELLDTLKQRLEQVTVNECPHETLLLVFADRDSEYFHIVPGNLDVFQVEVGYDFHGNYPTDDDVLIVQLIEDKVTRMITACEALGESRKLLCDIVEDWTTEAVSP